MSKPTTDQLVRLAWDVLPPADRQALEEVGADRWEIVREPLGRAVDVRLRSAGESAREELVAWVAWHEWGHALSLVSVSPHDPSEGERLLELAPEGIRERVRRSNYARRAYIHELIAETYAVLMRERVEGRSGQPQWLPNEIYNLMARIGTVGHSGASR